MSAHYGLRTWWGDDKIEVTADWAQASAPVYGLDGGHQVADFRHRPRLALRAAVEQACRYDGLDVEVESKRGGLISVAMARAWSISPKEDAT